MTELYQRLHTQMLMAQDAVKNSTLVVLYHQGRLDTLKDVLTMLEDKIRMEAEQ